MREVFKEPYFLPATSPAFQSHGETWVENNQQFRQQQKYLFFRNAIDYLVDNDLVGAYFEFGVHRARTFTMAMSLDKFFATRPPVADCRMSPQLGGGYFTDYFAFDSFEGFPPETFVAENPLYRGGHARTAANDFLSLLSQYGQSTERVRVVPGFYSESLNSELASQLRSEHVVASFVTIDCNLYESYRDVLRWCDEFLQPGSVLYLDDFNTHHAQSDRGPRRAWNEFTRNSRWRFTDFLNVGWNGRSFITQKRSNETP